MVNIYILKLENGKYYVGRTNDINFRLNEHFNNCGSFWTVKYKPIKIKKIYQNCSTYDEDKYTLMLMEKYGINNVRGGSFVRLNLSNDELIIINKMINNAVNRCFNCYMSNHYIIECPYDKINNNILSMRREIITECKLYDLTDDKCITINKLIECLNKVDPIIFKDIDNYKIYNICEKINKLRINGVCYINYDNNIINYIDFTIGLTVMMDNI